jgi:surface antigen
MRLRSDERAPLGQVHFRALPSLDQPTGDSSSNKEGSHTFAFHAALRRVTAPEVEEATDEHAETTVEKTAQPSLSDVAPHASAGAALGKQSPLRRRMVVSVVALLVLLSIAAGAVGARLGAGPDQQAIATPTPLPPSNPQAIAMNVATPTPTATPKPQPTKPPVPTLPPGPPYSTDGPYSNSTPPPGYASFAPKEPSPDPYAGAWGQCVWWAQYKRPDENFIGLGDAKNWANGARARGYTVTQLPVDNATVVFMPGIQGASSSAGHVSHVEEILTGGWVLVSEMNFAFNGGGWARVDYRYIHVGTGVYFIH